eukprot:TRINITY_DN357_c0_g1_i4.p1 TRINITY_DN357_c0_g1~~TRINITY_DN357_c0_g1_i4.p1  ORF type:complete len:306 (-),score=55.37 TRINITY_DN357_c0_g1_i4:106-978(-)
MFASSFFSDRFRGNIIRDKYEKQECKKCQTEDESYRDCECKPIEKDECIKESCNWDGVRGICKGIGCECLPLDTPLSEEDCKTKNCHWDSTEGECKGRSWRELWPTWHDEKWSKSDFAWPDDVPAKFKNAKDKEIPTNKYTRQSGFKKHGYYELLDIPWPEDEDFQVWMHPAKRDNFRKPHRKLESGLQKGDVLKVEIVNFFDVEDFGEKHIVVHTIGMFGQGAETLAIFTITSGALSIFFSVIFCILPWIYPDHSDAIESWRNLVEVDPSASNDGEVDEQPPQLIMPSP